MKKDLLFYFFEIVGAYLFLFVLDLYFFECYFIIYSHYLKVSLYFFSLLILNPLLVSLFVSRYKLWRYIRKEFLEK